MPKKNFVYKKLEIASDIWYTESLKGWFIVKEENLFVLRKGFVNGNTIEFAAKQYNKYKRLGDAKTGLENKLKEKTKSMIEQQILFNKLKAEYEKEKTVDYTELDKQAEKLKERWGLK